MASRSKKQVQKIDKKSFHAEMAEWVLLALTKHIPKRNFGRVRDPGKGFFKLASAQFARVVSAYFFFEAWAKGRKATRSKKPMFFFPDITDDPRVKGDYAKYPEKRVPLNSVMSKAEMRQAKKDGRLKVAFKIPRVAGEGFLAPALAEARARIRQAGLAKVAQNARSLVKANRSPRGLTVFNIGGK